MYAGSMCYRCPLYGCVNPLQAELQGVTYTPRVEVVEPQGMSSRATRFLTYGAQLGEAGGIGMKLHLYVTPLDVSFSEIAVEEVPSLLYEAEGYFNNPFFNGAFAHTRIAGAGIWHDVSVENRFAKFDEAGYTNNIPWLTPEGLVTNNPAYAWTDGVVNINNPFGWNCKGTTGYAAPHKNFAIDVKDKIQLNRYGKVGVFKLDNHVIRSTNGVITLHGLKEKDD